MRDVHFPFIKQKMLSGNLPGCPVAKTSPSKAGGVGSIPGLGAKIPHDLLPKSQNIKQEQYYESEVAPSCLTLCDPVVSSLPGSSVYGILQARILEWVAISFSRGSS